MNRIFPAVLLSLFISSLTYSQDPDSLTQHRFSEPIPPSRATDSIPKYQGIDTAPSSRAIDSIPKYQGIDTTPSSRVKVSRRRDRNLRNADTLVVETPDFSHSASKAIMYALVLPGLGQAYNRKFYKMPIVWAALGGVGYAIVYNSNKYQQSSLDYALSPDDINERYLRFWRRNLELSYIGLIAVYALQVVDAYVDAQLYSWDVNDDLSLRVAPSLQPLLTPSSITGYSFGLTCSFNLKRR